MTVRRRWHPTRARMVDLACIAVAAFGALVVAGDAESSGRVTGGRLFAAMVVGGVACAALWWRRRYPVTVAVLLAPLSVLSDFGYAADLISVYSVAAYRRGSVALAAAGMHVLAGAVNSIIRPDPDLAAPGANAVNVALLSVAVALGTAMRSRRELLTSLRERAERAEAEARSRAERLRALERERIAREMHDVLAHRISLVSLHAGALEIRPDLSTEEVVRAAGTIRDSAHRALDDLRQILGVLRDDSDSLRPPPELADLDGLVADCRSAGTPVEVDNALPDTAAVPASLSRTAYRIVQEGLTNARKHAPGAPVHVMLHRTPAGELHVWLRNRLADTSVPAVPGGRSGLVGLAERVSLAGGCLDHGVRRDADGTVAFHLEARIPWPA